MYHPKWKLFTENIILMSRSDMKAKGSINGEYGHRTQCYINSLSTECNIFTVHDGLKLICIYVFQPESLNILQKILMCFDHV